MQLRFLFDRHPNCLFVLFQSRIGLFTTTHHFVIDSHDSACSLVTMTLLSLSCENLVSINIVVIIFLAFMAVALLYFPEVSPGYAKSFAGTVILFCF